MMKQTWVRPQAVVQTFVPNEYVAACGDSGTVYKFECNAGDSNRYYSVYTNGTDGIAGTSDDVCIAGPNGKFYAYGPCGETHEAEDNGDFIDGYIVPQSGRNPQRTAVVIWTDSGTDVHCTTNLNKEDWETTKS